MAEKDRLNEIVLTRVVRLNARLQGIVVGLFAALVIFSATNWLLLEADEGEVVGPHLGLLGQFFIGYDVSFVGSLIGLIYGFGTGFLVGYSTSHIYNWIAARREHKTSG